MHVHSLYVKYEISANLKLRTLWEINTDQTTILNGVIYWFFLINSIVEKITACLTDQALNYHYLIY